MSNRAEGSRHLLRTVVLFGIFPPPTGAVRMYTRPTQPRTQYCLMLSDVRSKMAKFWHLCTDFFFFFFPVEFRPHRDPTYLFGVTSVRIADHTSLVTNVLPKYQSPKMIA